MPPPPIASPICTVCPPPGKIFWTASRFSGAWGQNFMKNQERQKRIFKSRPGQGVGLVKVPTWRRNFIVFKFIWLYQCAGVKNHRKTAQHTSNPTEPGRTCVRCRTPTKKKKMHQKIAIKIRTHPELKTPQLQKFPPHRRQNLARMGGNVTS